MKIRDIVLRQVFHADLHAEVRDAFDAIERGEIPNVSLGFSFWQRHHPEMLNTLEAELKNACRNVAEEVRDEQDQELRSFVDNILPKLPGIDRRIAIDVAISATPRPRTLDEKEPDCPLATADFLKPYEFSPETRYQAVLKENPVVCRAINKPWRYMSPFSQRNGFECGQGWNHPVTEFVSWLEAQAVALKSAGVTHIPRLIQAKEKFGLLRIYASAGVPDLFEEMQERLQQAETASKSICETCGAPGKYIGSGWAHVACEACEKKSFEDMRIWGDE